MRTDKDPTKTQGLNTLKQTNELNEGANTN